MIDPNGVMVQGFILGTGVIGQLFVSQMNPLGFYFWLASNVGLVTVSLMLGSYGMVALYIFFGVMNIYSIVRWNKLKSSQTPA